MRTTTAICMVICALGVAHAQAPDKQKAAAAYAEGQRRYAAGDYLAAAAKFIEAYAGEPDPAYLFNVAQSFRFANDCAQAATFYRRFLAAVTSAPNLDKVHVYLDEVEACARRQKPPSAPVGPAPGPDPGLDRRPPPPGGPPAAPPATPPATPPADASHAARGATKRHVGIAAAGVGLAAIGVGVWFHHDVGSFESQVKACTPSHPCTTEQVDHWNERGHAASTAAIAAYGAGGAALIAGVALYLLGRGEANEQPVAIAPTRGGAMVTAGFAF